MKIGDQVRFLSETGGGKVAGFQGKNIVLVEDEDGFQIPTPVTDVVVIGQEDYSTSHVAQAALEKKKSAQGDNRSIKSLLKAGEEETDPLELVELEPSDKEITFKAPVEERKGGNLLSCYLAFVPVDVKELTNTRFECFFVNDSNYYVRFTYLAAEGNSWSLRATGEIEPNTKEFIEEFGREDLAEMGHVAVQMLAYKRDKSFILKPAVEAQFRVDGVKFYKLHTFQENDFFEQPALLYTIVENDVVARPLVVDTKTLKKSMYGVEEAARSTEPSSSSSYVRRYENTRKKGRPFVGKRKGDEDVVVVDLHASELLDTTAGMGAADILNYQVETFRKTLEQYKAKRGQRIIFIHGKGEGVLRQSLIHELKYRYKTYQYQDASFQEYGYGATQVTIK